MASRDFFLFSDPVYFAGSSADEPEYWNDPEIIIDPISCMVVAVIPRTEQPSPKPQPRRPRRTRSGPPLWRVMLRRWLAVGRRADPRDVSKKGSV